MATKWLIDPTHSEIQFKVKHLMITTVTGDFKSYRLEAETETDDFSQTNSIRFSADINSIDTRNEQRDGHLKSPEFFDAEKFPELRFEAGKYQQQGESGTITGELTIRDTTLPITLNVDFGGIVVDPYGQTKAGFTITGKLSRKAYGLTWSAVTEAGSVVLSDEIKIQAEVQLIKQA